MSRAAFCFLSLFFASAGPTSAEIVPVDQRNYADSANGCAPATILNLLRFSAPEYRAAHDALLGSDEGVKMRFVVDRYFKNRPSVTYPGRKRWGVHGVDSTDFVAGLNEMLAESDLPALSGTYLDRSAGEGGEAHLLRCHGLIAESIRNGVMPVLSLRSFVVRQREEREKEPAWETGIHHFVLVTGVRGEPSVAGFELDVIDPWRGKTTVVYVHPEPHGQPFRALRGVEGEETKLPESGIWLDGKPFLLVLAPDVPTLRPANLIWSERFLVVANYLVGDF